MSWLSTLDDSARHRSAAGLRRALVVRPPDDSTVDLAGNDYLGLSRHPAVIGAAAEALAAYGLGATASRLVRGSTQAHATLEASLADWLGMPAALAYSSGYLANLGAVRALALARPDTLIVSDAHNHASIVDGCRLAARDGARIAVVPHADVDAVRQAVAGHDGPAVVITESVFSVDGDLAPLESLHSVVREFDAVLLVDEAHAVGLIGPGGAGAVASVGLAGAPDVVVTATLSKAFGAAGGVVAGPPQLYQHLLDTGRTFIYDTALPPAVAAGAGAALALIRDGDGLRSELLTRASYAVQRLRSAGLQVFEPAGGIISVRAPDPAGALAWAVACREQGVAVGCFRPPSTPDGQARLRLTVNVGVPRDAFDKALEVIVQARQ